MTTPDNDSRAGLFGHEIGQLNLLAQLQMLREHDQAPVRTHDPSLGFAAVCFPFDLPLHSHRNA